MKKRRRNPKKPKKPKSQTKGQTIPRNAFFAFHFSQGICLRFWFFWFFWISPAFFHCLCSGVWIVLDFLDFAEAFCIIEARLRGRRGSVRWTALFRRQGGSATRNRFAQVHENPRNSAPLCSTLCSENTSLFQQSRTFCPKVKMTSRSSVRTFGRPNTSNTNLHVSSALEHPPQNTHIHVRTFGRPNASNTELEIAWKQTFSCNDDAFVQKRVFL